MKKPEVLEAFNNQIREELNSAYIYEALAYDMEAVNFAGAGAWFHRQASEERGHARRLAEFVDSVGGHVVLQAIPAPPTGVITLKDAFTRALAHERHITACIHDLFHLARKYDDLAAESALRWFVDEQVEEEKTASDLLAKIEMAGAGSGAQYLLDRDIGKLAAQSDE